MNPISNAQIKEHIYLTLRQAELAVLPARFPMTEWLRPRAEESRVAAVYEKVKTEIRREFQTTIQRLQGGNGRRTRAQRRADADELLRQCGTSSAGMTPSSPGSVLPNGRFGRGGLK